MMETMNICISIIIGLLSCWVSLSCDFDCTYSYYTDGSEFELASYYEIDNNIKRERYLDIRFDIQLLSDNYCNSGSLQQQCGIFQLGDYCSGCSSQTVRDPAMYIIDSSDQMQFRSNAMNDAPTDIRWNNPLTNDGQYHRVCISFNEYLRSVYIDDTQYYYNNDSCSRSLNEGKIMPLYLSGRYVNPVDAKIKNFCIRTSNVSLIDEESTASEDCELIMDHKDVTNGYFSTDLKDTGLENENDPTANTYSIIGLFNNDQDLLNEYKNNNCDYKFKLIYKYNDGTNDTLIWTQTSWITDTDIIGADLSQIPDQSGKPAGAKFYGLALSSRTNTYLDGTGSSHNWWYHSVGSITGFYGGIPGDRINNGAYSSSLCIYKPSIISTCPASTTTSITTTSPTFSTYFYISIILMGYIIISHCIYYYFYHYSKKNVNYIKTLQDDDDYDDYDQESELNELNN